MFLDQTKCCAHIVIFHSRQWWARREKEKKPTLSEQNYPDIPFNNGKLIIFFFSYSFFFLQNNISVQSTYCSWCLSVDQKNIFFPSIKQILTHLKHTAHSEKLSLCWFDFIWSYSILKSYFFLSSLSQK